MRMPAELSFKLDAIGSQHQTLNRFPWPKKSLLGFSFPDPMFAFPASPHFATVSPDHTRSLPALFGLLDLVSLGWSFYRHGSEKKREEKGTA